MTTDPEREQPNEDVTRPARRTLILTSMTLLTAAMIPRASAIPAQDDGGGGGDCTADGGDNDCTKPDPNGGTKPDNECTAFPGIDKDCGKPKAGGGVHEDNDCVPPGGGAPFPDGTDNDCGKSQGGTGTWVDNDCGAAGGAFGNNIDHDCENPNHTDADCGLPLGGGFHHKDSDCGKPGLFLPNHDNDCAKPKLGGGVHSDDRCGKKGLFGNPYEDGDCATTGVDNWCSEVDIEGDSEG